MINCERHPCVQQMRKRRIDEYLTIQQVIGVCSEKPLGSDVLLPELAATKLSTSREEIGNTVEQPEVESG